MVVVLAPTPVRKRDVAGCEQRTLAAFKMAQAEGMDEALNALRVRCRTCRFATQSPILRVEVLEVEAAVQ
jgi:hypothetical protein